MGAAQDPLAPVDNGASSIAEPLTPEDAAGRMATNLHSSTPSWLTVTLTAPGTPEAVAWPASGRPQVRDAASDAGGAPRSKVKFGVESAVAKVRGRLLLRPTASRPLGSSEKHERRFFARARAGVTSTSFVSAIQSVALDRKVPIDGSGQLSYHQQSRAVLQSAARRTG